MSKSKWIYSVKEESTSWWDPLVPSDPLIKTVYLAVFPGTIEGLSWEFTVVLGGEINTVGWAIIVLRQGELTPRFWFNSGNFILGNLKETIAVGKVTLGGQTLSTFVGEPPTLTGLRLATTGIMDIYPNVTNPLAFTGPTNPVAATVGTGLDMFPNSIVPMKFNQDNPGTINIHEDYTIASVPTHMKRFSGYTKTKRKLDAGDRLVFIYQNDGNPESTIALIGYIQGWVGT